MRKILALGVALGLAGPVFAAPDVAQVSQKGSLLIWPDIRVAGSAQTLVLIQNDGIKDVDVKCYWMDGNKNRVDFIIPVGRSQSVWFDAKTGNGNFQVTPFPTGTAGGFNNPFLPGGAGAYRSGMLACWAVDNTAENQVKWNHLAGTATVDLGATGVFEYNAYAFFVREGLDLQPVGTGGTLLLDGLHYDSCPLYQIGQFSPEGASETGAPTVVRNRLAVVGCNLQLQQDWTPIWTKLQFDVWNDDEIKFTGAFECADSWHETEFNESAVNWDGTGVFSGRPALGGLDAAPQNFSASLIGTYAARYRVQAVASSQCPSAVDVGILGVQSTRLAADTVGTTLASAGKIPGQIVWDTDEAVPEGGIGRTYE
jgi:hypothetical protein